MKTHYNSFDEIKNYKKLINKPSDFKEFWERQIKKTEKIDLDIRLENVDSNTYPNFSLYYLSFSSFDGTRVYCKYIKAKSKEPSPLILQFHGYPGASRSFFELSSYANKGISVLAMDCRGQGGRTFDLYGNKGPSVSGHIIKGLNGPIEDHTYVKIFLDTYLTYRVAKNLDGIDKEKIYASGESQGAGLSIVCTSLNQDIKKASLLYPFLSDYKRVFELDYDEIAYEGLRYYSRWFDPDGKKMDEAFDKLAYIDASNFASDIRADIIYGISLSDEVCPPIVQASVFNEIKSSKKLYDFKGYGHEKICEMEEKLIPFFLDDPKANSDFKENVSYKDTGLRVDTIINKNDKCILYINPTIQMKSFYLRRFANLGYDIISLVVNDDIGLNDLERLVREIKKDYKDLVIMAYRQFANMVIRISSKIMISGLIIQGLIEDESLVENAKKIECPVLLATLGLDDKTSKEFNFKIKEAFKSLVYFNYAKFEYERINHFEDEKLKFLNNILKD